jgi:hypothetical protein
MGVIKKPGVYWIDYYANGHGKRERIGPDKPPADLEGHCERRKAIASCAGHECRGSVYRERRGDATVAATIDQPGER